MRVLADSASHPSPTDATAGEAPEQRSAHEEEQRDGEPHQMTVAQHDGRDEQWRFLAELDDDEAECFIDQLTRLVAHLRQDVPAAASASRAGRGA